MKKLLLFGLVAGVTALGASVFAGEEKDGHKGQMFAIYKDVIHPSKTTEYEAAIKYMISEFAAYDVDPDKINWKTVSGPELGYVFVMPIENFASIDQMHEDWSAAIEVIGAEKFEDMMMSVAETMDHAESFHVMQRTDLSYAPESPAIAPDDVSYIHYGFYYVLPGHKKVIEQAAREYAELYKSKGAKYGWTVYEAVTGTDLPVFVVAHPARSQSEFYQHRAELKELFGEEAEAIGAKVMQAVRRVDEKDGWMRPDLSYPQQEKKKAAQGTR